MAINSVNSTGVKHIWDKLIAKLALKVDKVSGKSLSTNDYTTAEKELVATIPDKADSDDISGSKNVTGNPIIIEDSANAYAEEVIANIEPIQDLHGYDHPWVGGAGKNLLPMTVEGIKEANTSGTWSGNVYTINGGTLTILTDSDNNVTGIEANGTFTSALWFSFGVAFTISAGTYTLSGAETNLQLHGESGTSFADWVANSASNNPSKSFSSEASGRFYLRVLASTFSHIVVKSQIEIGTTATTFAPYTNMSSITGSIQTDIVVSDHNIWDEDWELGIWNASGEKTASNSAIRCKNYINVIGGETYYVVCPYTSGLIVRELDSSKSVIKSTAVKNRTITLSASTKYVVICTFANDNIISYNNDVSFNYPSTITDYVPYRGHSLTISLGRTVYGGKLNVQTGELIVDRGIYTFTGADVFSDITTDFGNVYRINTKALDSLVKARSVVGSIGDMTIAFNDIPVEERPNNIYHYIGSGSYRFSFMLGIGVIDGTKQSAVEWITQYKPTVCFELATPITYHLTPEQVKLLKGYNYITTNADTLDITYQPDNVLGEILGESEGYTDRLAMTKQGLPVTILDDVEVSESDTQYTIPDISQFTMVQFVLTTIPASGVAIVRDTKTIPVSVILHNMATYTYNNLITLLALNPNIADTWTECKIEMESTTQISVSVASTIEAPRLSIFAW